MQAETTRALITAVNFARVCSIVAAALWLFGLPFVVMSAAPFTSDVTYEVVGELVTVLGLAVTPIVLAYPVKSQVELGRVVRLLGLFECVAMVVSGAALVGAAAGLLGNRAPNWIPSSAIGALSGLFLWVVIAGYSTRRSAALGQWPYWLAVACGASWLGAALLPAVAALQTGATGAVEGISSLLTWVLLPAWFITLALRMRSEPKRLTGGPT
jgi:hypothetical protein